MLWLFIAAPYVLGVLSAPLWAPAVWAIVAWPLLRTSSLTAARSNQDDEAFVQVASAPAWMNIALGAIVSYVAFVVGIGFEIAYRAILR